MHIKQYYLRYLYAGAFIVALLSVGLGAIAWTHFSATHAPVDHRLMTPTPALSSHAGFKRTLAAKTSAIGIHADGVVHLQIPALGVDAPIEMVGLDAQGRMGVPAKNQWTDVGWYRDGPAPGEQGSAVIDGHLDTDTGAPAVFWKLNSIHAGDLIIVKDASGHKAQFRVLKLQNYPLDGAPLEQIFSRKDGAYLNLITCAGSWDYTQNQFQQRLVVFTKLVE